MSKPPLNISGNNTGNMSAIQARTPLGHTPKRRFASDSPTYANNRSARIPRAAIGVTVDGVVGPDAYWHVSVLIVEDFLKITLSRNRLCHHDRRPSASVRGGTCLGLVLCREHGHERDDPSAPQGLNSPGIDVSLLLLRRVIRSASTPSPSAAMSRATASRCASMPMAAPILPVTLSHGYGWPTARGWIWHLGNVG